MTALFSFTGDKGPFWLCYLLVTMNTKNSRFHSPNENGNGIQGEYVII